LTCWAVKCHRHRVPAEAGSEGLQAGRPGELSSRSFQALK
jgi:hypothetical protein